MRNTRNRSPLLSAALLAALTLSATAMAAPQISAATATHKFRPPDPAPAHVPIELVAAKNEFVSFQVVVKADGAGAQNVTATLSGLDPAGGGARIEGPYVTLYREGYLNLTQMSFSDAQPGRYPDALIPDVDEIAREKRNAFPFTVPPNELRTVWVDILTPKDAAPGTYTGTIELAGDGFQTQLPITLSVLDTELPSTASLPTAFLFHRNLACRVHTGDPECGGEPGSLALRDTYQRMALEHRVTLSNVFTFPTDGNWNLFGQRYTPWMEGTADTRLPGARMTTAQFHGHRTAANFTAWEQYFGQRGWLDRAYDYTGDEPPWGISFAEANSRLQMVKGAAPNLRTMLTTTVTAADQNGLTRNLDVLAPVINHVEGTESPYVGNQRGHYDTFLRDPAKSFWSYQSCMSHGCAFGSNMPENKPGQGWPSYMVDASAARNRAMQWVLFSLDAQGELYYETALALDTAWQDVFRFNGNGDGTLFYPGTPAQIGGQTHVPVSSIRLKMIRQGMQDYEWLKKVADAGDPAFAKQIALTLAPSAHQVGDDGAAYDDARRKLVSRWLDLQPRTGTPTDGTRPTIPGLDAPGPGGDGSGEGPSHGGGHAQTPELEGSGGKRPRITGRMACAAAGPELLGLLGAAGIGLTFLRRRGGKQARK